MEKSKNEEEGKLLRTRMKERRKRRVRREKRGNIYKEERHTNTNKGNKKERRVKMNKMGDVYKEECGGEEEKKSKNERSGKSLRTRIRGRRKRGRVRTKMENVYKEE